MCDHAASLHTCKCVCTALPAWISPFSAAASGSAAQFHPEEKGRDLQMMPLQGSWKEQNDNPGDVQLIKMPQAFLGVGEFIWKFNLGQKNTGDQAFTGSAVVGGVHVCAHAYMCFLSE